MQEIKFSKSRYDLQKKCVGEYYFKYIEKKEYEDICYPGTIIGEAVHLYLSNFLEQTSRESFKSIKEKIYKITYSKFLQTTSLESFFSFYEKYIEEVKKTRVFKLSKGFSKKEFDSSIEKWIWEILKFVIKSIDYSENTEVLSEFEFTHNFKRKKQNIVLNGIIDLVIKNEKSMMVIDFKTTKYISTYYFVDWENDSQSLTYYEALRREFKKRIDSFAYYAFSVEDKMIVVNKIDYDKNKKYEENFYNILDEFITNHNNSSNIQNFTPSKENCRWCKFKQYCSVGV